MSVNVKGRNIDVTPALKDYVEKKVVRITKQFKTVGDITAVLKIEKENHIIEITVPASGILLRAQESTKDMYSSIDLAVEKIERQIRKYKTRLMKRKYDNFTDAETSVADAVNTAAEENGEFEIVKNKRFVLHPMTVEEAILQMNLLNHDFFVFYDPDLGNTNVVYRRKDGKYGLLSPEFK
ncbi:MAG: ribosome-associated translation inhibitor RaiA [Phascolarctobacterium sp.]|nr:ribosome-associated translation inhibitor RaiA [Phascolarctobacterium sp.]